MNEELKDVFPTQLDLETDRVQETKNLPVVYVEPPTPVINNDKEQKEIDSDIKYIRDNLYGIIEKGQDALENLTELANAADDPRSYRVVGELITAITGATKELVELQKARKEIKKTEIRQTENNVTNNNLILTTDELIKKILNK